jgi:hypothetical protein
MRHLTRLAVLALVVAGASPLAAQRTRTSTSAAARPSVWEFGIDAALSFGLDDPNFTMISIPAGAFGPAPIGSFRAGIFTSDVVEIEPFFALNYTKFEGSDGGTIYQFGSGLLYHFSAARTKPQLYARPFLALRGFSGGGNSDSDLGGGVGVGMKWPKMGGRLAWRGEANVAAVNETTTINFLWGLSYFTR